MGKPFWGVLGVVEEVDAHAPEEGGGEEGEVVVDIGGLGEALVGVFDADLRGDVAGGLDGAVVDAVEEGLDLRADGFLGARAGEEAGERRGGDAGVRAHLAGGGGAVCGVDVRVG